MTEQSRAAREQSARKCVVDFTCRALILAAVCFGGINSEAAVDLVLAGTDSPDPVLTLSNVTYTLTVTNIGSTTATNVTITNILSSRATFVSATTTRGSCTNVSGVVRCDWGNVNAASGGRITIIARASGPGIITNVASCAATQADATPSNNSLVLTTTAVNRRTFGKGDFIQVDDVVANVAVPYPSTITVSGLTAAVYKVTCTLSNVTHSGPDDLDILLVGPNGGYLMLMSDGPITPGMTDVTITFDDAATQYIPDTNAITTGIYKPANYGSIPDIMPAPAPEGPHFLGFTPLSIFNGINPNGDWQLFVYDDEPEAGGWIDGWSLTISTLDPMADVGVSLTDSPDPAVPGGTITYTARITNAGPVNATGVRLTNQVFAGLQVVSYTVSRGSCTNQSGTISCDIGTLALGGSEQLVVQARASNGGNYNVRADVASDQYDPRPVDNMAIQATLVNPRVDIAVDVTSSRTPALLEQPLIYTLAVTNIGPDTATGVQLVDQLPPGVLLVNFSASQGSCSNQAGVVTCNLGTLASQGRATVFLTCRPTVLGPITNVVSATSDQIDNNSANNSAQNINSVDPAADVLLSITDAPDPVLITQPLTYSISVTNRGPSVATNVVVVDALPGSLRLVSLQSTRGACTNNGNSVTCVIGDLQPAERAVVTIVATPTSVGTVANTASVSTQSTDPNPVNNTATASTPVLPTSDISVTKVGDRSLIWEGDRVTYSLVISNSGPSTATGARLSDALPPAVSYNSATATAGSCSFQGGLVTCSFGDLAVGASVAVSIVATAGTPGVITNSANAIANEQDLSPGNNVAVVVTTVIPRTVSRSDPTSVTIPDLGTASIYPLTINVSGMTAAVQRVRVTLVGLSHTYPDDLDVLLVGPGGQAVVVMSDAGGSTPVTNLNLTLDDLASGPLPDAGPLTGSLYRPADYDVVPNEFPPPAPSGPYASSFDVFTGTDPNGTWKLYVVDDQSKDQGSFAGGWRLDIWARDPLADLAVSSRVEPTLVAVGSNVTVRVAVSNNGPATAGAVILTNVYGPDLAFVSAVASQGSCTNDTGLVQCLLGDLAVGTSALVDLTFTVINHGALSNSVGVTGGFVDIARSNDVSTVSFVAENPAVILTQPRDRFVPSGSTATFIVVAGGDPPLGYQWYYNSAAIPGANTASLTVDDVQPAKFGDYQVQVSNRVGSVFSRAARLGLPRPPVIETIPDQYMDEDTVLIVPLPISDPDDPFEAFHLSATCDDTNLIPTTNLIFIVTGTNYALRITPGTNQFGTNSIRITAIDTAGLSASQSFTLGVQSVNDYPQFIVPVHDQVMPQHGSLTIPFVIGDVETPASALIVGARAYNPAMILLGVSFYGSDSNRTIFIADNGAIIGTTLFEIRVRDEAGVRTTNLFTLTVQQVNDPPRISRIDDITVLEDSELNVRFTMTDEETAPSNLVVSAVSSNVALFGNDAFTFTINGGSATLHARPVPNASGLSRITIFVRDEGGLVASNAFLVTVNPVNDPPFISEIPTIETTMNQTSSVVFVVADVESGADSVTLTAISTNTVLAPVSGVQFGGSGSNRTVRITPGAGEFGWTVLRVRAADPDGGTSTRDFELFVHQTNGPPVIFQQPTNQSVTPGTAVTLRVAATGPGRLTYHWQREGQDLVDATNATLNIASAAVSDRGEYRVRVTNAEGTTTSAPAQLNVLEGTRILSIRRTGSTVELTFGTIAKQRYFVEFQNVIGTGWTVLSSVVGTGEVLTAVDPSAGASSRFYRVRIE